MGRIAAMSEWVVALIATGGAVLGSLITGRYAHTAGGRGADAAAYAGDRQADATLEVMRATLAAERRHRLRADRREVYGRFVAAAEAVHLMERTGEGAGTERAELRTALARLGLEGPADVVEAAGRLADSAAAPSEDRYGEPDPRAYDRRSAEFFTAARAALDGTGSGPTAT